MLLEIAKIDICILEIQKYSTYISPKEFLLENFIVWITFTWDKYEDFINICISLQVFVILNQAVEMNIIKFINYKLSQVY